MLCPLNYTASLWLHEVIVPLKSQSKWHVTAITYHLLAAFESTLAELSNTFLWFSFLSYEMKTCIKSDYF
jgi:hypothetical protein